MISVLLSASVERCFVCRMRDFLNSDDRQTDRHMVIVTYGMNGLSAGSLRSEVNYLSCGCMRVALKLGDFNNLCLTFYLE